MSKRCIKLIAILLFLILIITGCSSGNKTPEYWPTDEWRETSPEQMGMDSEKLIEMLQIMESDPIDSVTIIRNGYIVLDAY